MTHNNLIHATILNITMDKESAYELQKIDCNCNDCKFMIRDFDEYNKWEEWNRKIQLKEFNIKKANAFMIANDCKDLKGKETLLNFANKMVFIFDKSGNLSYGNCEKFQIKVSFIPNVCQIETQECFKHRKD